jgi:hypothetical protein
VSERVNFIWLGGQDFVWQHWRAIETARQVQGEPIFWTTKEAIEKWMPPSAYVNVNGEATYLPLTGVEIRWIELPDWLRDHPIQLANVKDLYVWRILYEHGGLYLDLDTISLRPVWDLLTRDVVVSREWPPELSDMTHQYNSAVVLAKKGAPVLARLFERAQTVLEGGEDRWGKTGPHLLTEVVAESPHSFTVPPFPVLSGWRDDTISDYYDGERPGKEVRVIHLYSSSRMKRFLADRWMP